MFLFRCKKNSETETLYGEIMAQARQPFLYHDYNVADTPAGRFQMIALHAAPIFRDYALQGNGRKAQALFDMIFADIELSFREIGVGDLSVPKKMKSYMKNFNGIMQAHAATDADHSDITQRNVFGDEPLMTKAFKDYIDGLFARTI